MPNSVPYLEPFRHSVTGSQVDQEEDDNGDASYSQPDFEDQGDDDLNEGLYDRISKNELENLIEMIKKKKTKSPTFYISSLRIRLKKTTLKSSIVQRNLRLEIFTKPLQDTQFRGCFVD
jgi:hypothetical protein